MKKIYLKKGVKPIVGSRYVLNIDQRMGKIEPNNSVCYFGFRDKAVYNIRGFPMYL
jgi:hypothetical protein